MMLRKKYTNRTKFNFLLFIIGLSLGGIIGFILIQGNTTTPPPTEDLNTENNVPVIDSPEVDTPETDTPSTSTPIVLPTSPKAPSLGNIDAPVTMYEFSDFQCPYCQEYSETTFKEIKKAYIDTGKVFYIFKNLPLPIHPQAFDAAVTTYCAQEQDKFWEMHDRLFNNQNEWGNSPEPDQIFATYAQELGIDVPSFENCVISETAQNKIQEDLDYANDQNINLTPTFYINETKVVGAQDYQTFADIIDTELNK